MKKSTVAVDLEKKLIIIPVPDYGIELSLTPAKAVHLITLMQTCLKRIQEREQEEAQS